MSSIAVKTPAELAKMRQAGRIVGEVLRLLADIAEPGMTTGQLNRTAGEHIRRRGGEAAFNGYRGFPADVCTSINEEVVHGIPGPRKLREGDLLKVDVGVIWEGYHADAAVTIPVGDVTEEGRFLVRATRMALEAGVRAVRAGARVSDISTAVQQAAEKHGFSLVREYTGHGIGRALHEEPQVPNVARGRLARNSPVLPAGAALAIEPMVNVGTYKTEVLEDGWTVVTRDRKLSAHFEHTVAVEQEGPVILTVP